MALMPDEEALNELDVFKELRMVLAIGQQPEVFLCVEGKPVATCANVDVDIEDGSVVISAGHEVKRTFTASGAMVRLPSGAEIYIPYDSPRALEAGQWINTWGTITPGATD